MSTDQITPLSQVEHQSPHDGYAELRRRIISSGLFESQPRFYTLQVLWLLGLFAVGVTFALTLDNVVLVLACAVFLSGANVQAEMLGHDVGHRQVLRTPRWPHIAGLTLGNLLLGISYSFWIDKHDRHHVYPNHSTKDPDGNYTVLALTEDQIITREKILRPLVGIQAFLFPFWLLFQPLLMRKSATIHVFKNRPTYWKAEVVTLALHGALYGFFLAQLGGWPMALAFVAVHQGIMGVYNGLVFAPNHKGMPVVDDAPDIDYIKRQVVTARNVHGGPLTDTWFGGLNYQIEHHLFPTLPRNHLGKAQPLVREYCEKQGIPYENTSFLGAYAALFSHLHRMGAPLRHFPWFSAKAPTS